MPSGSLGSRVALAALCAAMTALAATPSDAQTAKSVARAPRKTLASPAEPLPSLAPPLTPPGQSAKPIDSIPDSPVPLMRGGIPEREPTVSTSANYGAPVKREKLPRPYPPPRTPYPPRFSPKNALPALEPYKTSYVAKQRLRLRPTTQPGQPAPPRRP